MTYRPMISLLTIMILASYTRSIIGMDDGGPTSTADPIYSAPHNTDVDPEETAISAAFSAIMASNNPVLQRLRDSIFWLGEAFERLWHKITGQADDLSHAPGGPRNNHQHPQNIDAELQEIAEHIKNLQVFSSQTYETMFTHLSDIEAHTLHIMSNYSKRALLFDAALGSVGLSAVYFIYDNNWPSIFSRAHGRFITGLEIPAALSIISGSASAAKIIAAPLAKPIGLLLVGCYCWSKLKRAIQLPLILKHKSDIEQFKAALATHQKNTNTALEHQLHNTTQALQAIKANFEKELAQEREKNKKLIDACTEQSAKQAHIIEQTQHQEAAALRTQLLNVTQEFQHHLQTIEGDVAQNKQLVQEEKELLDKALPKVESAVGLVHKLVVSSQEQLDFVKAQAKQHAPIPAVKSAQPKKHWWNKRSN